MITSYFCIANEQSANAIIFIIQANENASGQQINLEKMKLSFSHNMPQGDRLEIHSWIGVRAIKNYKKKFDLPTLVDKSKKKRGNSFCQFTSAVVEEDKELEREVFITTQKTRYFLKQLARLFLTMSWSALKFQQNKHI